ncbi:MAG: DNA polymerase III subunit delta [Chloroflexi bacterium]|nr:DNA polymerase III subunit delta [Chloroflexota bacterium]
MLYLFCGENSFGAHEELGRLKERYLPPDLADLNLAKVDGAKATADEVIQLCEAMPFLAEKRLVIIEGLANRLSRRKAGEKASVSTEKTAEVTNEEAAWKILEYIGQTPPFTIVVCLEETSLKKDHPLYKAAVKHGEIKEFKPLEAIDLQRWIADEGKRRKVRVASDAAEELAAFVGSDLYLLSQELDKLATYVGDQGEITRQHVHLLTRNADESDVFDFVDQLGQRNGGAALVALRRLLDFGTHPSQLLVMVARQFRLLLQVKERAQQHLSSSEVASALSLQPWLANKLTRQAQMFALQDLERIYQEIVRIDNEVKLGRSEPQTALDLFVAEVCYRRASKPI